MPSSSQRERSTAVVIEWDILEPLEGVVDRHLIESVLAEALAGRKLDSPLSVGLVVTDDEGIRELNRRHRGVDAPTDVLSFPLEDYDAPEKPRATFPRPRGVPLPLGDIVISYERAVEQAESYGHSLDREIAFLVVHGALHLLGYDHEQPAEAERMRREEEAVLQRLGLGR